MALWKWRQLYGVMIGAGAPGTLDLCSIVFSLHRQGVELLWAASFVSSGAELSRAMSCEVCSCLCNCVECLVAGIWNSAGRVSVWQNHWQSASAFVKHQSRNSNGSAHRDSDDANCGIFKLLCMESVQCLSDDEGCLDAGRVKRFVETLSDEEPASGSAGPHVLRDRPLVQRKRSRELPLEEFFSRVNKVVSRKCKCHRAKRAQTPRSNDDNHGDSHNCLAQFRGDVGEIAVLRQQLQKLHKFDSDREASRWQVGITH